MPIDRAAAEMEPARSIGMSYRRAWLLVVTMNRCFLEPLVETHPGGGKAAGAKLTSAGEAALAAYRSLSSQVERGEAPIGIVYATDARASKGVRVVGTFPAASHPPITYPVALLRQSTHRDADGFRRFLLSREGRAIFARYGFPARQGSNK